MLFDMRFRERRVGTIVAVAAAVVLSCLLRSGGAGEVLRAPLDFSAFRCAGQVVARGGNPYRVEPLRSCEVAAQREVGRPFTPHLVVPAPLPPSSLLAFTVFGDYRPSALWAFTLFAALVLTCVLLRPMIRAPLWVVVLPIAASGFLASVVIGQLIPLELAALVVTAASLRAGRPRLAAIAATVSMLEPQLGLPICIALALWEPRTRIPLAAGLAALVMISLMPGGATLDLEYVNAVIPQAALTEGLDAGIQFSLSAQLALLGVAPPLAAALGVASYGLMIALGVRVGGSLAKAYDEPALAIAAPSAFALLGGPYVHLHQIAMALPLALLLIGRARAGAMVALGVGLLGIPWQTIAVFAFYEPVSPNQLLLAQHLMDMVDDGVDATAAGVWSAWLSAGGGRAAQSLAFSTAMKLPTWLGLLVVLGVAVRGAFRPGALRVPAATVPSAAGFRRRG